MSRLGGWALSTYLLPAALYKVTYMFTGSSSAPAPRQKSPPASFMPRIRGSKKRVALADSSGESAAEVDDAGRDEDEEDDLPHVRETTSRSAPRFYGGGDEDVPVPSSVKNPRSSQSVATRLQKTVIIDDGDGDEDEDDEDDEDDDVILPSSAMKRRRAPFKPSAKKDDEDDDDDDEEYEE